MCQRRRSARCEGPARARRGNVGKTGAATPKPATDATPDLDRLREAGKRLPGKSYSERARRDAAASGWRAAASSPGRRKLASLGVAPGLVLLHDRPRRDFLGAPAVAAGLPRGLLDVLVLAALLRADAA